MHHEGGTVTNHHHREKELIIWQLQKIQLTTNNLVNKKPQKQKGGNSVQQVSLPSIKKIKLKKQEKTHMSVPMSLLAPRLQVFK